MIRSILIIRQQEEALQTAELLKTKGLSPYICPLFTPQFFPLPSLKGGQGLIITSKNALRALKNHRDIHDITDIYHMALYAVGDETANLARAMGFSTVWSASGNVTDLMALIRQKANPRAGILWYLTGNRIAGHIQETLTQEGFDVRRSIVYQMAISDDFPLSFARDWKDNMISHVLFFSPHTTAIFGRLLVNQGLDRFTTQISAVCMSEEVAKKALILEWKEVWVSPHPSMGSLLEYFKPLSL